MKSFWIDGYEANVPQRLGSSQVAFELLKNFEEYDFDNDYTVVLPESPVFDMPKERNGFRYKILKPKKLWTRIALPFALYVSKQKPDLIFSPTHYIPRFSPIKRVGMIFDLSFLYFPQMFQRKDLYQLINWSKFSILNADHIITISNFTKKDIIKRYKIRPSKVTVVYPGYNYSVYKPISDKEKIKEVKQKYGIKEEYVIFIGTIQPRKNLIKLMEAIARVKNLRLVVVGKITGIGRQAWMFNQILKTPSTLRIDDRVIFTDYVSDENLAFLINGSKAFILPSLYEGFGIPVIESMACGIPVLVSDNSCLPEVTGKAGLFFNPNSVDQIEQAIRTILADKKLWRKKSNEALIRARKYSWQKMAKEVRKILDYV